MAQGHVNVSWSIRCGAKDAPLAEEQTSRWGPYLCSNGEKKKERSK
jgi:hypothetical protein